VVGKLESQYGVPEAKEAELGARMVALKQAVVARVAGALQARPPEGTLADTVRHLINALHQVTDEKPSGWCAYQRRLWEDERRRVQPLVCDLNRLSNWIAVYDGYVAEDPTPERTAETLRRLEIEVLGRPHCLGRQRCSVRLGEPISMADHYVSYRASKSATVDGLTRRFEDSIRSLLAQMR
jgi:hypothetical protein